MSKKRESNVGWVIIHPDGHYELDYFNTGCFGTKLDNYKEVVTPEFWRDVYRPDCEIKLMKLTDINTVTSHPLNTEEEAAIDQEIDELLDGGEFDPA